MRTLRLTRPGREPPCPEVGGLEGQRPKGNPDLETGHDLPKAKDAHRLPLLPHRDPRRATDADARITGGEIQGLTTGEPCAVKVASTVRRGADGKGRRRLPVRPSYDRPKNSGTRRTSPAAYPTSVRNVRRRAG